MEMYCVKCRSKREMSNAQAITMKNGRPATRRPPRIPESRILEAMRAIIYGVR